MCDYALEGLRKHVPTALASISNPTVLGNYKSYLRKMETYRRGIGYGDAEWKRDTDFSSEGLS